MKLLKIRQQKFDMKFSPQALMQNVNKLAVAPFLSIFLMTPILKAQWFPKTYEEGRKQFRSDGETLKSSHSQWKVQSRTYQVPSLKDQDLTIDTLTVLPAPQCAKLLIIVSGTHGAEGFIGSGLQHHFLTSLYGTGPAIPPCLLMIHALNPYGFKNFRRVTENNVDLNRNFPIQPALYSQENPGYSEIKEFLNPPHPARIHWASSLQFLAQSLWQIATHGMGTLRQSILQGQYEHEKGLFFGGKNEEPQVALLRNILRAPELSAPMTIFIDLHTGYGKRGQLHLLGDHGSVDMNSIEKVYPGEKIDFGNDKDFYKVNGGLSAFVAHFFSEKSKVANLVYEYGTLDSQTTLGSMESLRRMILENQMAHHGASPEDRQSIQRLFNDMFYPQDPEWQKQIIEQTDRVISKAL